MLPRIVLLIATAGALSGCGATTDTYRRPHTWHPSGVNAANIAAQVADPEDLVVGRGSDTTDAAAVVPGIQQVDGAPAAAAPGGGAGVGIAPGGSSSGGSSGSASGG